MTTCVSQLNSFKTQFNGQQIFETLIDYEFDTTVNTELTLSTDTDKYKEGQVYTFGQCGIAGKVTDIDKANRTITIQDPELDVESDASSDSPSIQ